MALQINSRNIALLLCAGIAAIAVVLGACDQSVPSGQSDEPTPTQAAEEEAPKPEPTPTPTPEPEPTPTPEPTPDPAKLSWDARALIALRNAITTREEAANLTNGDRSEPVEAQPPVNFGLPIPMTLRVSISAMTATPTLKFLSDNGGNVIGHYGGPDPGLDHAVRVAFAIDAEIPTALLEDLAPLDDVLYIFLSDPLYPHIGSPLKENVILRALELLTPEGRTAPPPERIAIWVYANHTGHANVRRFVHEHGGGFARNPVYPEFDLIAPMYTLPGVRCLGAARGEIELPKLEPLTPTGHDAIIRLHPCGHYQGLVEYRDR